jgi:hypothetical protein
VFTLAQCFDDEGEVEETEEEHVELLEAGEDSSEALQPAEEALDFVALLVEGAVILPWLDAVGFGRHHRDHAQRQNELASFIAFVGPVHQHRQAFRHRAQIAQQFTSLRRIVRVTRRQGEGYGRSSIRGNHMNLGVPSAAAFADGLWTVFFRAPVPSG